MGALVTIDDVTLSPSQWAAKLGVTRGAISFRRHKYGETSEQAVLHFARKNRLRNVDCFANAAQAEAGFDKFCLKTKTGTCQPWACTLPRDTGASSCLVAWLFALRQPSAAKNEKEGK
jgi:hypothetical protein